VRSALVSMMLVAALVSGCSLAPPYQQPVLPIADRYSLGDEAGAHAASKVAWQNYFGDPRLRAYIAAALANNRDLAAAAARIDQAHANYRIQNAQRLPEIDLGGSGTRAQTPVSVLESQAGAATSTRAPTSITSDLYGAQVGVTAFELDFWGRVRNLSEAQRREYLASVDGADAFRLALISDVASTYLSIVAGEEGIALAQQTLDARLEGHSIAKLRLDAGVTSTVDFDQSALLVSQAQSQLAELQRSTEQARNALTVLVGGPITATLPEGRSIADQNLLGPVHAGLPSDLLVNRPDVKQAEENLRAANANIGAARAAFFPSISLTGNYGYESPALSSLFKSASQAWMYGASVDLPIFDWGRRQAGLDLTKARQQELIATYQKAVQTAFREVSDALVARQRLAQEISAFEHAVKSNASLADATELRYQNGVSTYLEVLDARRNLFSAQQALIQLKSNALQNSVTLYIALGGDRETVVHDRKLATAQ
jgi:outer membrane protein, multidrug efflux system